MDWTSCAGRAGREMRELHLRPPLVETRITHYSGAVVEPPLVSAGRVFLDTARFYLAVLSEDRETMASGEGRLWVAAPEDREHLVKAAVKAFGKRKVKSPPDIEGLEQIDVMFLSTATNREGDDKGTWTHSKWSGPEGVPEFFVAWSEAEKRGVIREKDVFWRNDLLDLLGSVPVYP